MDYKLYNGNCFDILPNLIKDNIKIDLILTDPPYILNENKNRGGINLNKANNKLQLDLYKNYNDISFVCDGFDYKKLYGLLSQLQTIPNMIFFCSNNQLGPMQSFFMDMHLKTTIAIWYKYNAIPAVYNHLRNDIEYILIVRGKGAYFNNDLPINMKTKVFTCPIISKNKFHPCEKPEFVLNNLIQLFSKENSTILDCFMGSGSTGITAIKNNRNFIGIEILEKYYNIANNRIINENNKLQFFNN